MNASSCGIAKLAGPREALDAGYFAALRQSGLRVGVLGVRSPQDATHFREAGASLLPGMQGVAKIDAGRAPLAWQALRPVVNALRMWLWI